MEAMDKPTVFVVVQLSGGNDFMNTIVPYQNDIYYDSRPVIAIPQQQIPAHRRPYRLQPELHPSQRALRRGHGRNSAGSGLSQLQQVALPRTDIWHTAEPDRIGTEGWLGQAVAQMDPARENPLTCVNIGRGLPRAMAKPGVR